LNSTTAARWFAVGGERRPCFFHFAGAHSSRTARARVLLMRPGNCCFTACQSFSPEEVSPRSISLATRPLYHDRKSGAESGAGRLVGNLDTGLPPAVVPTESDRGSPPASFCVARGLAWDHSRITSARQNSTSLQASRCFDRERSSTGETSWARACSRATSYCRSISGVGRAKKVRSFHSYADIASNEDCGPPIFVGEQDELPVDVVDP